MMSERYECELSSELLKKAVSELNEPECNDERLAAIDKLRTRFEEQADGFELIRSDDAFLLRFLRTKKFDQDRAYEMLFNYHTQRKEWREMFDLVDSPEKVEDLLRSGVIVPLRNGKAKDGSFVIVGRPGMGFDETKTMTHFIACLVLTMEKLLEKEEFQINGITVIEDMTHFGLSLALQTSPIGKRFLHVIQEAMPIRMKSLNMVNEALVFDIIHAIISPFMKEKTKKRMTLIGKEYSLLQEKVDKSYLPFFLGGSGPDLNPDWWAGEILSDIGGGEDTAL